VELAVRRRVQEWTSIDLRQGCRVQELAHRRDDAAVTGVRYTDPEGRTQTVDADLVIDASGRGMPTLDALAALGRVPNLSTFVPQLRRTVMLPGCGHWTQQERAREVNDVMLEFLKGV
jgi:pimeloyl-ACP methyl ester carboxylesterase